MSETGGSRKHARGQSEGITESEHELVGVQHGSGGAARRGDALDHEGPAHAV